MLNNKILLLDVGGVIIKSPWELLDEQYPLLKTKAQSFLGPLSGANDTRYHKMISGTLSEGEYWIYFISELRTEIEPFRFAEYPIRELISNSGFPIRNELVDFLRYFVTLGGKVITFSNGLYKNLGSDWWLRKGPTELIHKHYDASEIGISKPDPMAFLPLLKEIESYSSEMVLYLDDNPVYVQVAQSLGIPSKTFSIIDQVYNLDVLIKFCGTNKNSSV